MSITPHPQGTADTIQQIRWTGWTGTRMTHSGVVTGIGDQVRLFLATNRIRFDVIRLENLVTGEVTDVYPDGTRRQLRPPRPETPTPPSETAQQQAVKRLATIDNREAATDYLTNLKLSRKELVALAEELQVAVFGTDTVSTIRRKIADATAGVREDTAAIHSPTWRTKPSHRRTPPPQRRNRRKRKGCPT